MLREITYILQIPLRATIALQKHDLTLSDVYGIWMKLQLHLQACMKRGSYKTSLAKHLLNAITDRKNIIFKNPFMGCALFLDPRFRSQLDEQKVQESKQMMCNIWQRISLTNEQGKVNSSTSDISFEFDEQAALDQHLQRKDSEMCNNTSQHNIEFLLDLFDPEPLPTDVSILKFWESAKNKYPELHKLAMVIYSIPPTEVQIERDFSRLNYIFTNRRCNLQSERLEDIMIININPEVFHSVQSEELIEQIEKHEQTSLSPIIEV